MFLTWHDWFAAGRVRQPELELVSRRPRRAASDVPLLFVHGAFAGAWCWEVNFLEYFAGRGYEAHAMSLRGHGRSRGRRALQYCSLDDYVDDVASVAGGFDRPPVLVGHSMGGLVVQRYLERGEASAVVLMASVPPSGLMESGLRLFMQDPILAGQLMMMHNLGPNMVDNYVARRALFSAGVPEHDLAHFAANMQPESQRAIWELYAGPAPRRRRMGEVPMLVAGAEDDSLIAPESIRRTARFYGVEAQMFSDMAHAMMLEPGWRDVADQVARFLEDSLPAA